ncbi:MAG: TolC family protein [Rhodospirillaceae bacterium]
MRVRKLTVAGAGLLPTVLAAGVFALGAFAARAADPTLTAAGLLERIDQQAQIYFAEAAADLQAAEARLARARAGLFPRATAGFEAERYQSALSAVKDKAESTATFEVVQPIYDFGVNGSRIDAARADADAAKLRATAARNRVLMEGLALYHDLHASDLNVQTLNQKHASAYVRWERVQERERLGQASPVKVAERLAAVEASRLILHNEQRRNMEIRLRLGDLTGLPFDKEMLNPPLGPKEKPAPVEDGPFTQAVLDRNPDLKALARKRDGVRLAREGKGNRPVVEAFGVLNQYSRPTSSRDDWTVGARIKWPFYDGGVKSAEQAELGAEVTRLEARIEVARRELVRIARTTLRARENAWQQLIATRARHDFQSKFLLQRQRLYEQERVTDLGNAMINFTDAEADVVRAAGNLRQVNARLAVMMGEHPKISLDQGFLLRLLGQKVNEDRDSYTPKSGSGFGQKDQNEIKR